METSMNKTFMIINWDIPHTTQGRNTDIQTRKLAKAFQAKQQTKPCTYYLMVVGRCDQRQVFLVINNFGAHLCYKYSMFKSQNDSTDIYSDQSQAGSEILLRLSGLRGDWHSLLLNGQGCDFRIIHRGTTYSAHRAVIFKHMNLHVLDDETTEGCLQAPHSLNPHLLAGVLSCLYGLELKICRSQALQTLDVVHFLKVSRLKRILQEDILGNLEEYDLFPVLERARYMGMQEVEEACMRQLHHECFEQMRYCKFQLLSSHEDVFRFVLQSHHERRVEDPAFGVGDRFVQDLIQQYCAHNGYNQRRKTLLLRSLSELSSKPAFPSLGDIRPSTKEGSNVSINVFTPRAVHTDSMIAPSNFFRACREEGTRSMIMDLTFMGNQRRKRTNRASEHNSSHSKMALDVIAVRETYSKHAREIEQLKDSAQKIELILTQKEGEVSNNKFRLSQIERLLEECEKQIMENNRNSRLLQVKFDRFEQKRLKRCQSDCLDIDIDLSSEEEDKGERKNPKDHRLRVSLIQSRWVCC